MPVAVITKEKTWSKLFPTIFKSEQQSLVFMKKLFAVAISNIVYIRSIFPEYAFFDKQLEGIKLKILREDSKCPGAAKVINWVRGCFDALDRHYLKTVIIGFYTDFEDPDTVIESYSFKFTYGQDSVSIKIDNKETESELNAVINNDDVPEKIKKATISLLRTMILAGNTQDPLPEKVIVTMKLLYYDEGKFNFIHLVNVFLKVTPDNYEPNGFRSCDYAGFRHETETINAKLGQVETDFHSFRMILRTDKVSFTENYVKSSKNNSNKKSETDSVKGTPTKSNNISKITSTSRNIAHEEEFIVRCPCGGNKDDGIMIMCETCKNWQHSICFAIMEEDLVPEVHICDTCADLNLELIPTDVKLKNVNVEDRQELCLIRRAIMYCRSFEVIEPEQLCEILGVEVNVGKGIFHTLIKEGALVNPKRKTKNKGLLKVIDKGALESHILKKFFNSINEVNSMKETRKRKIGMTDITQCEVNTCTDLTNLNIMNASQDSVIGEIAKKRRRAGIAKTPVLASRR